jgi:hypothetical protein
MPVARTLLCLVDVVEMSIINAHLVNRPELILYDIRVIIIESVLNMDVKSGPAAEAIDKHSL